MYKELNIGTLERRKVRVTVKILEGKLSISGNTRSCMGQISNELRERIDEINFKNGWNKEKFLKLLDIWDKWHLNDMHPECEHQRELGWVKEGKDTVQKYTFALSSDMIRKRNKLKDDIISGFLHQKKVENTKERRELLSMPYRKVVYTNDIEEAIYIIDNTEAEGYDYECVETVTRGWISYSENQKYGILEKPCPVCGYRYGTEWKRVELPSDVVSFLEGL